MKEDPWMSHRPVPECFFLQASMKLTELSGASSQSWIWEET